MAGPELVHAPPEVALAPQAEGLRPPHEVHPGRLRAGERLGRRGPAVAFAFRVAAPFRAASLRRSRRSAFVMGRVSCRGQDARGTVVGCLGRAGGPVGAVRRDPPAGTMPAGPVGGHDAAGRGER